MPKNIIDASQYDTYINCPAEWYEIYVNGVRDEEVEGEGPLVLGSLFHEGLHTHLEIGKPEIPVATIEKLRAFKPTVTLAQKLLYAYLKAYPPQEFNLVSCERALEFPLVNFPTWKGISKIDAVFRLDEPTPIKMWDREHTLPAGVYGLEHKTRQKRNMSGWLAHWDVRMQADFEMLAMQEHFENVKGIVINTVEYKPEYVPVRTCPDCNSKSALRDWTPREGNMFGCPFCNKEIEVKPIKRSKDPPEEPMCYRFFRTRTEERLRSSIEKIVRVAKEMDAIIKGEKEPEMVDARCVRIPAYSKCRFFDAHVNQVRTKLVQVEDPYAYIFE